MGAGFGLGGRQDLRSPIRSSVGGNRMCSAMSLEIVSLEIVSLEIVPLEIVPLEIMSLDAVALRPVAMTGMGPGLNRRELHGDQQDRRSKNPQKRAGQSHER